MKAPVDLLTVLYDIDMLRGRGTCKTCRHYNVGWYDQGLPKRRFEACKLGYGPYGSNDTCEDWQEKPT